MSLSEALLLDPYPFEVWQQRWDLVLIAGGCVDGVSGKSETQIEDALTLAFLK